MRSFTTIASLLLIGAVANAATIVNGSFELGLNPGGTEPAGSTAITGWVVLPTDIDWISGLGNIPETFATDGSLYLDLNGDQPGGISQTFTTVSGQLYRVTFDMNANGTEGQRVRSLEVSAGADSATFSAVSGLIWTTYNFEFIATSASTDLSFVSLFTTGSACGPAVDAICAGPLLDNVRISDAPGVPEPATVSLTILGLILGSLRKAWRT